MTQRIVSNTARAAVSLCFTAVVAGTQFCDVPAAFAQTTYATGNTATLSYTGTVPVDPANPTRIPTNNTSIAYLRTDGNGNPEMPSVYARYSVLNSFTVTAAQAGLTDFTSVAGLSSFSTPNYWRNALFLYDKTNGDAVATFDPTNPTNHFSAGSVSGVSSKPPGFATTQTGYALFSANLQTGHTYSLVTSGFGTPNTGLDNYDAGSFSNLATLQSNQIAIDKTHSPTSVINVASTNLIQSFNGITIHGLQYDYAGDLTVTLKHVTDGKTITLFNRLGSSGNFGGAFAGDYTFTDGSTTLLPTAFPTGYQSNSAYAVTAGTYKSSTLLSTFNNTSVNGAWDLIITNNNLAGAGGSFTGWDFNVTAAPTPESGSLLLTLAASPFFVMYYRRHRR